MKWQGSKKRKVTDYTRKINVQYKAQLSKTEYGTVRGMYKTFSYLPGAYKTNT